MKKLKRHLALLALTTALLLMLMINVASAKTLTVVMDLSGSNPLLIDEQFNQRAARYVGTKIAPLEKDDNVFIKTLGSLNNTSNFKEGHAVITRHNTNKVARSVGDLIASLPKQAKAQGSTNLVAFWGRHHNFDCDDSGVVIVLTDAIEASEYANPEHLLAGKSSLPKPNEYAVHNVKGCTVHYFGVGTGRSDKETLRLRKQWQAYFDAAGATFKAIAL